MRIRTSIVLAAGLALTAALVAVTLSRSPLVLAGASAVPAEAEIAEIHSDSRLCQAGETLPADTAALRIGFNMALGAALKVDVLAGKRVIAHGSKASGWRGAEVTVPIRGPRQSAARVMVCVTIAASNEPVGLIGARSARATAARSGGQALPGRIRIEYLRDGRRSWWAKATAVGRRLALGRAWSGGPIALLALALMAAIVSLASWLALRSVP